MDERPLANEDNQQAVMTTDVGLGVNPQDRSENTLPKLRAFWSYVLDSVKARVEPKENMPE